MLDSKRARTVAIQESLMNGGAFFPLSFFDSRRYKQHNVLLEDGLGAILSFVDGLPRDRTSATVHRSFEDGDYSIAHTEYRLGDWGPMVGFEIHRWEDDRIVEHWDNLQATPSAPNGSGRSMVDGASDIVDHELTELNKSLVKDFTESVLIPRRIDSISRFFERGKLIQHSPILVDGEASFRRAVAEGTVQHRKLHKVLGEGNFVLTLCEGTNLTAAGDLTATSFYDLYRVSEGHIAEHWDVVETIAPRHMWSNDNGKF